MKFLLLGLFIFFTNILSAQINFEKLKQVANTAEEVINPTTKDEVVKGIKEALIVGAKNSVLNASEKGGFNNNSLIKISFPKSTGKMKDILIKVGMRSQVDNLEFVLNEAAEEASFFAKEILVNAVKKMTVNNAIAILNGSDHDATLYLKKQTSREIYVKFHPIVKESIEKVKLGKYWNILIERYNQIPLTKKVNTDLAEYVTIETIEGLFLLISQEEKNIRNNPHARVSDILQKVFK
tara:strand:- start:304 stop:1017 length:714 start_codon:yes stop_codon:yes gene_type:complete